MQNNDHANVTIKLAGTQYSGTLPQVSLFSTEELPPEKVWEPQPCTLCGQLPQTDKKHKWCRKCQSTSSKARGYEFAYFQAELDEIQAVNPHSSKEVRKWFADRKQREADYVLRKAALEDEIRKLWMRERGLIWEDGKKFRPEEADAE